MNTIRQKFACFNCKTLQSYIIRRSAGDAVFSGNASAVSMAIRAPQKNFLEMGEAVQHEAGRPWWNYITQTRVDMDPFPTVAAIIQDLPGNRDAFFISQAGELDTLLYKE